MIVLCIAVGAYLGWSGAMQLLMVVELKKLRNDLKFSGERKYGKGYGS